MNHMKIRKCHGVISADKQYRQWLTWGIVSTLLIVLWLAIVAQQLVGGLS